MLMGATKSNVIGVIMTEQILIGVFANIFGIGLGMIFLKLFLWYLVCYWGFRKNCLSYLT